MAKACTGRSRTQSSQPVLRSSLARRIVAACAAPAPVSNADAARRCRCRAGSESAGSARTRRGLGFEQVRVIGQRQLRAARLFLGSGVGVEVEGRLLHRLRGRRRPLVRRRLSRLLGRLLEGLQQKAHGLSPVWSIFGSSRRRCFSSSLSREGLLTTIGRMKITSSLLVDVLVAIGEQVADARQVSDVGHLIAVALHVVLHQPAQDRGLAAGELQHRLHLPHGDLGHQVRGRSERRVGVLDEAAAPG